MTRVSRSQPSRETVAVDNSSSARRAPAADPAGGEDPQAVAVAEDRDVALDPSARSMTRSTRRPTSSTVSPPRISRSRSSSRLLGPDLVGRPAS
jgi:hypothetical protein